ncbi:CDP-glycerol glycerophosphotransferase family protein [Ruminococcus sp.]|uniref:CDP-glycerol glycerophosphotransferase family protein n=1 Tax=Ruminococcus sp. TaxID=41978 RepID=UPI0025EB4208|nr:CDP-glycerol glycerophosphotransferase family protein [Ruminococcus sp.]
MLKETVVKCIKYPYRLIKNCCFKIDASNALKRIAHKANSNAKIKVGFIVQMPEIWDKQLTVYEAMLADEMFDPYLIVLPSFDLALNTFKEYGEELEFFRSLYPDEKIILAYYDEKWIDLKELKLNYVFYQRCWENYLPECYTTKNVIKYSKTCYIPYCFHGLNVKKSYYSTLFFYYLYMMFCCSNEQLNEFPKRRNQKRTFSGFPSLEGVINEPVLKYNSILWTPRWTDDKEFGGSTFFKYMYSIMDIKKSFPNTNLVLRPHPLTFQNAIKTHKLTETEIEDYKTELSKMEIQFDKNKLIEDSFLETDILITDFSSVLMTFFLTGKPIIYCAETDNVDFTESFTKIIECSYIAQTWSDVMKYVSLLLRGEDPLKERRYEAIRQMTDDNKESTKRILQYLFDDNRKLAKE